MKLGLIIKNWFNYLPPVRWIKHAYQRVKYGVSYRDAWNVDHWLANTIPSILKMLNDNTHSYPSNSIELHNKLMVITGGKVLSDTDFYSDKEMISIFHDDLALIAHYFKEYAKETPDFPYVDDARYEFTKDEKTGCYEMNIAGTSEQLENHKKNMDWMVKDGEYRCDCLHKAIRMLNVYITDLWD